MSNARVFINAAKDLRVSIIGKDFAILGNDELVTNEEIFSMYNGNLSAGWLTERDYLKTV